MISTSPKRQSHAVSDLEAAPSIVYLTGSRYFGTALESSDWDYFAEYDEDFKDYLWEHGWVPKDSPSYGGDGLCVVVLTKDNVDIQLVNDAYKKLKGDWAIYESAFLALMTQRKIETTIAPDLLHQSCLLCSEDKPHHCHRRLVAEYLAQHWTDVRTKHLL